MTERRRQLGITGEQLAAQFLLKKGYRILARNLKFKYGEIDILALDRHSLVVIEVKAKSHHLYGLPGEMITPAKQRKLRMLAAMVAQRYPPRWTLGREQIEYRIDVITIDWQGGAQPTIEHYIAAC